MFTTAAPFTLAKRPKRAPGDWQSPRGGECCPAANRHGPRAHAAPRVRVTLTATVRGGGPCCLIPLEGGVQDRRIPRAGSGGWGQGRVRAPAPRARGSRGATERAGGGGQWRLHSAVSAPEAAGLRTGQWPRCEFYRMCPVPQCKHSQNCFQRIISMFSLVDCTSKPGSVSTG